jgi:hypothetical protein
MKKLVFCALSAMALAACGGGGGKKADADINVGGDDAGPTIDAGAVCNPATQAGCDAGEKCANLDVTDMLSQTTCVPDGDKTEGQACTVGEPGQTTGYDDCVAGYHCLYGQCAPVCVTTPDSCRTDGEGAFEGEYCTLFAGLYEGDIGVCIPACDPTQDSVNADNLVVNDNCPDGFGCYANLIRGIAGCSGVPAPAATIPQNGDCYGPMEGSCFLNGCASGFAPFLNDRSDGDGVVCTRLCQPADSYLDNDADRQGLGDRCTTASLTQLGGTSGIAGDHECRFIQSFYSDTDHLPDSIGFCVPVQLWDSSCSDYDYDAMVTFWNNAVTGGSMDPETDYLDDCTEAGPDGMLGTDDDTLRTDCWGYVWGCVSLTKMDTDLMDPAAPAPGAKIDKFKRLRSALAASPDERMRVLIQGQ